MKTLNIIASIFIIGMTLSCGGGESSSKNDSQDSLLFTFTDSLQNDLLMIKTCVELNDLDFNSDDYSKLLSDHYAEVINTEDTTSFDIQSFKDPDRRPAAAGVKIYFWPEKITLKVQFLEGDSQVIDKVISKAKIWENFINIKFQFGTFADPDITISFNKKSGSWSYIGVQSKKYRPSMNFGWLTQSTNDLEYERVVLHEFGHALGLIHEHQNPNGNPIKWNIDKTYKYFMYTQRWSPKEVDVNIFEKYSMTQLLSTEFDPYSIMLYEVPGALTLDHYSTRTNYKLSEKDKTFVSSIYKID